MRCEEAQELITGLVDDELSSAERGGIGSHLADCPDCRGQWERETALKNDVRRASAAVIAPQVLRTQIENQLNPAGSARAARRETLDRGWLFLPGRRPVWALAIVILVVASLVYQLRPRENLGAIALATHGSVIGGKDVLARSNNPAELRKQLALAVNNRFAPVALDLSIAKLYPVAGFLKKIGGREVLVTVYEGDGPTITCFTFLGTEADAPKDAKLVRDDEMRVSFYIFTQGPTSAVMHEEGEVICLLIADMAPAELLDLLRGKAHHA
ncbi:MAG TPA: zf-HC2 domain-containing protein [Candidatus Limnocylindria bacterium]|nr:zf-HC2 domain-containing protein [Candidatus Limnocylindria bacterium]